MEDIGIRNLIFISSISIYTGNNSRENFQPFNETSNIDPEGFYGKDKLKSEKLCIDWSHKGFNRKCNILRLSGIHGGGRRDGVIYKFIEKLLVSEKIFIPSPFSRYSILYIKDAVKAILLLLKREKYITNEIFNIGGVEDMQLIEIAQKIKKIIKSESILEVGNKQPKLRSMDISKAQRELRFNPELFENWIKKEISLING